MLYHLLQQHICGRMCPNVCRIAACPGTRLLHRLISSPHGDTQRLLALCSAVLSVHSRSASIRLLSLSFALSFALSCARARRMCLVRQANGRKRSSLGIKLVRDFLSKLCLKLVVKQEEAEEGSSSTEEGSSSCLPVETLP